MAWTPLKFPREKAGYEGRDRAESQVQVMFWMPFSPLTSMATSSKQPPLTSRTSLNPHTSRERAGLGVRRAGFRLLTA